MFSLRPTAWFLGVAAALAGTLLIAPRAPSEEKENPLAALVKAAVKDPAKPFTLVIHLKIKEGSEEKLEAAFAKAVKATRQEKGNRVYDLNRDTKTPTEYLVYERWQNVAALEMHLKSPHITTLLAELGDLLASPPEIHVLVPAGDEGSGKQ